MSDTTGHPSQAEGEDPDEPATQSDPVRGTPSQAEGDDTAGDGGTGAQGDDGVGETA